MAQSTLAWLVLLLVGCTPMLRAGGTLQPRGLGEHEQALHKAVAAWNAAVPRLGLRVARTGGKWVVRREDLGGGRYGNASQWRELIRVDTDLLAKHFPRDTAAHVQSTIMHELGHALGMRGEHAPIGLMSSPHAGYTCVDAVTLAWLVREQPDLAAGAQATCR